MPGLLLSGPAGGGKTAAALEELLSRTDPAVVIDFQQIYAGLLGIERGPDGRFPERVDADAYGLALAEFVRLSTIRAAREQEVDPIVTNSDGNRDRRGFLLGLLGPGASERVIDPGIEVVTQRLTIGVNFEPSEQCRKAINRWYGRV